MKMITTTLALAAAATFASANPLLSRANLVARQDTGNSSSSDSPVPECQNQCASFFTYSECPDPVEGGDPSASYGCVCNAQFFEAVRTCAACTPELFSDSAGNDIEAFIAASVTACAQNGFPVNIGNTTSGTPGAITSGVNTTSGPVTLPPPTTRASGTGLGGLTGSPISTSPAPSQPAGATAQTTSASAQPAGAASQLHVAAGMVAIALVAGLCVLL